MTSSSNQVIRSWKKGEFVVSMQLSVVFTRGNWCRLSKLFNVNRILRSMRRKQAFDSSKVTRVDESSVSLIFSSADRSLPCWRKGELYSSSLIVVVAIFSTRTNVSIFVSWYSRSNVESDDDCRKSCSWSMIFLFLLFLLRANLISRSCWLSGNSINSFQI